MQATGTTARGIGEAASLPTERRQDRDEDGIFDPVECYRWHRLGPGELLKLAERYVAHSIDPLHGRYGPTIVGAVVSPEAVRSTLPLKSSA